MVDDFDFEVMGKFEVSLPISSHDTDLEAIQDPFLDFDTSELFLVAADANEASRARWVAMCRLPAVEMQRLSDTLVLRHDDSSMWSAIESCPPTNSDAAILALRGHLDSVNPRHRRAAICALSRMGDAWAESEVDTMLAGDNPDDHLFAIHCVAQRGNESANVLLRTYVCCNSNPVGVRIEVAELMLSKGFDDVLPFLYCIADRKIEIAYNAATAVKHHNSLAGLQLYDAILAIPVHPATPITVLDICMNADCDFTGVAPIDQLGEARRLLATEIGNAC